MEKFSITFLENSDISESSGVLSEAMLNVPLHIAVFQGHARRWTFRQSKFSAVHSSTTQALIIGEGMHSTASKDVQRLIENLSQELFSLGVCIRGQTFLSARSPRFEFDI